jgi:phosphatidate cytidylyltransferase
LLGTLLIAALVALCWLDFRATRPGTYLQPLAVLAALLAVGELLGLYRAREMGNGTINTEALPRDGVAYAGTLLILLLSAVPMRSPEYVSTATGWLGWSALGVFLAMILALAAEMWRYTAPGHSTLRLVRVFFAMSYAGGLMAMLAQLRLLSGEPWGDDGRWGMLALVTTIAVVKANDTGAYTVGRLFGRHKMTPTLSPGKTWEGAAGGMAGSLIAALLCLGPLARSMGCVSNRSIGSWLLGCLVFAVVVGIAGVLGDLSISLLKRDAQVKDSSTWMPGFGGVLDVLDSILLAAPVSYLLWVTGVVGP